MDQRDAADPIAGGARRHTVSMSGNGAAIMIGARDWRDGAALGTLDSADCGRNHAAMSPANGNAFPAPCGPSAEGGLLLLRDHPDLESRLMFHEKWEVGRQRVIV